MAWIKDQKANAVADDARRAIAEGRQVFAARFWTPSLTGGAGSVASWAEQIEAVEAEGWQLAQWTVIADEKGRPQAFPLFRRSAYPGEAQ